MGILDWLGQRRSTTGQHPSAVRRRFPMPPGASPLVQVTGTTTSCKDSAGRLVSGLGLPALGHYQTTATVRSEGNARGSVGVYVDDQRLGYLPSYVSSEVAAQGWEGAVPVQLFSLTDAGHTRVEAWAWLDDSSPRWTYSAKHRPPMTPEEKRAVRHHESQEMVREALAQGGRRAQEFRNGMIDGVHYLETVEPIKQLKREGRLREALDLCYLAIAAAENESRAERQTPAPWYTEQAAIIHRKLGEREAEVAVLERWLHHVPARQRKDSSIGQRLAKLTG